MNRNRTAGSAVLLTVLLLTALAATLVLTMRKDGYFADPAGLS